MSALPIRFLPEARDEFDAAADWYEQQRAGLGVDFVTRVREVLQGIAANPQMYGTVYQDVPKAVVRRFPYLVLYREDQGEVIVISVFHTSRDPSNCQSRV
jgi:plasmid stabilization system protein ParE